MNAGPRNGSTARTPRRSPVSARSAAWMMRASPGRASSPSVTWRSSGIVPVKGSANSDQPAPQPTDGPRPSDCGVLESGDGWCRPSSSDPYSVIIDPLRVVRSALQNGASVAGLLLTTNTLVEEQTPWGGSAAL